MDLNLVWFLLIAVLYAGFLFLEGFDYGVGMMLPFLGKNDNERRAIINTIGPFWDGNEVWLLTAGGATFAAFPLWYATMFGGFYLALFLLLLALIVRGIAFEFRSKNEDPRWRAWWDRGIFVGSLVPPLLLGVAFANLMRGVPIDASAHYIGSFFDLLNPYALLGGAALVALCAFYGAVFLSIKTTGELEQRARRAAMLLWLPAAGIALAFFIATYFATDIVRHLGVNPGTIPIATIVFALVSGWLVRKGWMGWAFVTTGLTVMCLTATIFLVLFPRVMVSSLNPAWSLTIYNASSSPYTLTVMTIVAVVFVPIILGYQAWTYWTFRKRVEAKPEGLTY